MEIGKLVAKSLTKQRGARNGAAAAAGPRANAEGDRAKQRRQPCRRNRVAATVSPLQQKEGGAKPPSSEMLAAALKFTDGRVD